MRKTILVSKISTESLNQLIDAGYSVGFRVVTPRPKYKHVYKRPVLPKIMPSIIKNAYACTVPHVRGES